LRHEVVFVAQSACCEIQTASLSFTSPKGGRQRFG
jgi:hypothetical protein